MIDIPRGPKADDDSNMAGAPEAVRAFYPAPTGQDSDDLRAALSADFPG